MAIVFFATIYLFKDSGVSLFDAGENTQREAELIKDERFSALNASVQAALEANAGGAIDTPVSAAQNTTDFDETEMTVTRNAPLDVLALTPEVQPEVALKPQTVALTATTAADFFSKAQANNTVDSSCQEDLTALAESAKIYFPAGGLSGEDAGLSAARLIGMVASECPGFTVQVEGHSDPSGDSRINQVLSEKRAQSIINRLSASGIDTTNFVAIGHGDKQGSNVQGPEDSAYYDRRVEFSIVPIVQKASFTQSAQQWQKPAADCVGELEFAAEQARQFYSVNAITAPSSQMDAVFNLAAEVARCEGAWLRIVGHHTDEPGTRESVATGRMRALAMLSNLKSAGFSQDRILISAPSFSVGIAGQPGLPNSRVDFQIVSN